jgi:hypothetical protein
MHQAAKVAVVGDDTADGPPRCRACRP